MTAGRQFDLPASWLRPLDTSHERGRKRTLLICPCPPLVCAQLAGNAIAVLEFPKSSTRQSRLPPRIWRLGFAASSQVKSRSHVVGYNPLVKAGNSAFRYPFVAIALAVLATARLVAEAADPKPDASRLKTGQFHYR